MVESFVTAASLGVMHGRKSWVLRQNCQSEVRPRAGDGKNIPVLFSGFCLNCTFLFLNSLFLFPKFSVSDNIPIYSSKLLKKIMFIAGRLNLYILFQALI